MQNNTPEIMLRLPEVVERTALSPATLYRLIAAGRFPAPNKLTGSRAARWRSSDIQNWLDRAAPARIAG